MPYPGLFCTILQQVFAVKMFKCSTWPHDMTPMTRKSPDINPKGLTPIYGRAGHHREYLDSYETIIGEAHARTTAAGLTKDQAKTETTEALAAAETLRIALQKIQSFAKQKFKMLAEDGDPETNFPLDAYLIGNRIAANRATLCQSAVSLIKRATDDSLPGFKTQEKVDAVQTLLDKYKTTGDLRQEGTVEKEIARLTRDQLIDVLNTRRSAIQHAADAIWPYTDEMNRPIRKSFEIPLSRPLGI